MVSGLVTSPCDHSLILCGEVRLIRMALKLFTSSIYPSHVGLDARCRAPGSGGDTAVSALRPGTPQSGDRLALVLFKAGQVDIQFREAIDRGVFDERHRLLVFVQHLDVQAQALE